MTRSAATRDLFAAVIALVPVICGAQGTLIDRVIAVVSNEPILYSDVTVRVDEAVRSGEPNDRTTECTVLENLLFEKMLLEQSRIDSVEVDDAQVEAELERRIRYFVAQIGSEKKMEEFYGKPIGTIKAEFRERVREQLLIQTMQEKVTGDVLVTPRDVQNVFNEIPPDSLPRINAQVEWGMIVMAPEPRASEVSRVKRKLEEFRQAIVAGEKDFCVLAGLYSEDPGSKDNCGELGMVSPGMMVQAFDAVALSLREGETSQVFETEYGFHIMRMIQRLGQQYNAQHILIGPRTTSEDQNAVRHKLDSLAAEVRLGRLDFAKAAGTYSDDEETRGAGGAVMEPDNNSPRWSIGDLDQQDFFVIDKMKVGEVSDPIPYTLPDGKKAWRIIRLNARTEPHIANLKDDQPLFQRFAEARLRQRAVDEWMTMRLADTYVKIDPDYASCVFQHEWVGR